MNAMTDENKHLVAGLVTHWPEFEGRRQVSERYVQGFFIRIVAIARN